MLAFKRGRRQQQQVRKPAADAASSAASPVRTVIAEKQTRRVNAVRAMTRMERRAKATMVVAESSEGEVEVEVAALGGGPMELDSSAGSQAALGFPQAHVEVGAVASVDLTMDL